MDFRILHCIEADLLSLFYTITEDKYVYTWGWYKNYNKSITQFYTDEVKLCHKSVFRGHLVLTWKQNNSYHLSETSLKNAPKAAQFRKNLGRSLT